ncbi:MAG: hypothetical protein AAFY45_27320 [Bacteroidota bacterium]
MKKNILAIGCLLLTSFFIFSCNKDQVNPSLLSLEITVRNTLQTTTAPSVGVTGGLETPIEMVFGLPEGVLVVITTIGTGVEYQGYLDGLYDIDVSDEGIAYNLVASADHPIYSNFLGLLKPVFLIEITISVRGFQAIFPFHFLLSRIKRSWYKLVKDSILTQVHHLQSI